MGIELTKEQKLVRDLRNNNLLVSAAAGSGKTAVLVERIKALINDAENPVSIDSFLIVTFTRAAAFEMKERIYKNLSGKEKGLVPYANITTIDGFCSKILKENFNQIGISPDFSVSSEAELKILELDCLEELIEEKLKENEQGFSDLCSFFFGRDSLDPLKKCIIAIYRSSESMPWPKDWLLKLKDDYRIDTVSELENLKWYTDFTDYIRRCVSDVMNDELALVNKYSDEFMIDVEALKSLLEMKDEDFLFAIKSFSFPVLRLKKIDGETKKKAQKERDALKKMFSDVALLAISDKEDLLSRIKKVYPIVDGLIDLVIDFRDRLLKEKHKRNNYSFSDVEHFALSILRDEQTKDITEVAKTIRDGYSHICVDEYQDSNYLQEAILSSIVKTGKESNYFMVGDVKQSIYRFRKARPDLFTEKYEAFNAGMPDSMAIDLSKNFRSREVVTKVVNSVFEKIMKRDLGKIEYDNSQRLEFAATYYSPDEECYNTELFLANSDDEYFVKNHYDKDTAEAMLIGKIIKENIVGKVMVTDDKFLRPARYSDIVILHRSANDISSKYVEAIRNMGVPVLSTGKKGYFETYEINSIVSFLNLLNNPFNDIALSSVLINFFDFSENDLLKIRQICPNGNYSDAFFELEKELEGKYQDFVLFYKDIRSLVKKKRLYEVLQEIIIKTGFDKKILSMPGGKDRISNIEKLVDLAIKYERFGNSLFDFVNYISDIKEFEIDVPISITAPKDSVTLMTIHKSKGLEFPICILAGSLKVIKNNDSSQGGVVVSEKYGLGLDFIDTATNTKRINPGKESIKLFENMENRAEIIRLLYVALTRAKEKLIVTGVGKSSDVEKILSNTETTISGTKRLKAQTTLELMLPGLLDIGVKPIIISGEEISECVSNDISGDVSTEELSEKPSKISSESVPNPVNPYPVLQGKLMAKYSVSELKKAGEVSDNETGEVFLPEREFKPNIPDFIKESNKEELITGSERGSAYHKIMELAKFTGNEDVEALLENSERLGYLTDKERKSIVPSHIETFFLSDLGKRMVSAGLLGKLFKEQFFVMKRPSTELFPNLSFSEEEKDDTTLVQGIIDAFFYEDDKIVLMDYKTDGLSGDVPFEFESILIKRYKKQLELYKIALENATKLKVKEVFIYSFALGREIKIEL